MVIVSLLNRLLDNANISIFSKVDKMYLLLYWVTFIPALITLIISGGIYTGYFLTYFLNSVTHFTQVPQSPNMQYFQDRFICERYNIYLRQNLFKRDEQDECL